MKRQGNWKVILIIEVKGHEKIITVHYISEVGEKGEIKDLKGQYLLSYFHYPECVNC